MSQIISETILSEDDPAVDHDLFQAQEYQELEQKLLSTSLRGPNICNTNTEDDHENAAKIITNNARADDLGVPTVPKIIKQSSVEGITYLMAACQQGLEHDVRAILRR